MRGEPEVAIVFWAFKEGVDGYLRAFSRRHRRAGAIPAVSSPGIAPVLGNLACAPDGQGILLAGSIAIARLLVRRGNAARFREMNDGNITQPHDGDRSLPKPASSGLLNAAVFLNRIRIDAVDGNSTHTNRLSTSMITRVHLGG